MRRFLYSGWVLLAVLRGKRTCASLIRNNPLWPVQHRGIALGKPRPTGISFPICEPPLLYTRALNQIIAIEGGCSVRLRFCTTVYNTLLLCSLTNQSLPYADTRQNGQSTSSVPSDDFVLPANLTLGISRYFTVLYYVYRCAVSYYTVWHTGQFTGVWSGTVFSR